MIENMAKKAAMHEAGRQAGDAASLRKALPLVAALVAVTACSEPMLRAQTHGAGPAMTGERRRLGETAPGLVDGTYVLRAGDVIEVNYRYTPELNDQITVGPDGKGSFKAAGSLQMAGRTMAELQTAILSESRRKLVDPEITVTLKEFDRPHVIVAGEVNTPGRQDLRRPTTALQAILMCGGAKDDAALGRVLLFRRIDADTAEVHVLQLSHYDKKSRTHNDMLLQPDDMILVQHDTPSRIERYVKLANFGLYLNPLQNVPF